MKCISFNVNSIRLRLHQLEALIETHQPDIIGLQETKVTDEDFPASEIRDLGYHVEYFGQKTHYGVAMMSKYPFEGIQKGFPNDDPDAQKRFISGSFSLPNGQRLTVINGYFPQGESRDHAKKFPNKQQFYADLHQYLQRSVNPKDLIIVMGDMNICPEDSDIGIGEQNRKRWLQTGKCSFLPEEREWLRTLFDWGLTDSYRSIFPNKDDKFSWFDYRTRGFDRDPKRGLRIDLILANEALAGMCQDAGIDYNIRAMEKPSDHCPIWAEYTL